MHGCTDWTLVYRLCLRPASGAEWIGLDETGGNAGET